MQIPKLNDIAKRNLRLSIIVAFTNFFYLWLAFPFLVAISRSFALASSSIRDVPLAIQAIYGYTSNNLLSGPITVGNPFGCDTILGWLGLFLLNTSIFWIIFKASRDSSSAIPALANMPKRCDSTIYGDAHFLITPEDYKRESSFAILKLSYLQKHGNGGAYLGMDIATNQIYLNNDDEHMVLVAPSGQGKTRRNILQMLATLGYSGESVIAFDPKGELFGSTFEFFKDQGYEINRIDFNNPANGSLYNPLDLAIDNYTEAREITEQIRVYEAKGRFTRDDSIQYHKLISKRKGCYARARSEVKRVVDLIMRRDRASEGNAAFWIDGAEAELSKCLNFTASWDKIPDSLRTIQTALRLLVDYNVPYPLFEDNPTREESFFPLDEMIVQLPEDHPAREAMQQNQTATDMQKKSFITSAVQYLKNFASYEFSVMMRGTDHKIKTLCDSKTVTFIIVPENKTMYKVFAQLYFDQVYAILTDESIKHGNCLPRRMNIIAEELGQLPKIEDFDQKLSISRGRGMRWIMVLQDLSQLENSYEKKTMANIILNNCKYHVLLGTDDYTTAKMYSDKWGTYTTCYETSSESREHLAFFPKSHSQSERFERVNLIDTSILSKWDVDANGGFVHHPGNSPAIVPMPRMEDTPFNKILGLGSKEFNAKKVASALASSTHEDNELAIIEWIPAYGLAYPDGDFDKAYFSPNQLNIHKFKWIKECAKKARRRRGFSGGDSIGLAVDKKLQKRIEQAAKKLEE